MAPGQNNGSSYQVNSRGKVDFLIGGKSPLDRGGVVSRSVFFSAIGRFDVYARRRWMRQRRINKRGWYGVKLWTAAGFAGSVAIDI